MSVQSLTLPEALVFGDTPVTEIGVLRYDGVGIPEIEARMAELSAKLDAAPDADAAPIAETLDRLTLDLALARECRDNPVVYALGASAEDLMRLNQTGLYDEVLAEEGVTPANTAVYVIGHASGEIAYTNPLADRFREVLQLLLAARLRDAPGDPDDYLAPAEMSDEELIFQATMGLPADMAADVARLRAGDDYGKADDSCLHRFDKGETPVFELLGYPADGGLKAQARPFEDTLSVSDVIAKEIASRRQQFSVSRSLAEDDLRRQQQASQDQSAFKGGV